MEGDVDKFLARETNRLNVWNSFCLFDFGCLRLWSGIVGFVSWHKANKDKPFRYIRLQEQGLSSPVTMFVVLYTMLIIIIKKKSVMMVYNKPTFWVIEGNTTTSNR